MYELKEPLIISLMISSIYKLSINPWNFKYLGPQSVESKGL